MMQKRYPIRCYMGVLLLIYSSGLSAATWNGGIQNMDVIDDNLTISNTNDISGNVQIFAQTTDIVVTVASDAVLRNLAVNDALHFRANSGRTITLNLDAELVHTGNASGDPFTVTYSGAGNLIINLGDNAHYVFNNSGGAGAFFLIGMDTASHGLLEDSVIIQRANKASDADVQITVGGESGITFISGNSAVNKATLRLDPTNDLANSGRFILNVIDNGAILIQGHLNTQANVIMTSLADIDFGTLTGLEARVKIINDTDDQSAGARLLVINENTMWPELRNSPWCQVFSGAPQKGFMLGANGLLEIGDNSYLDYVGLALNTLEMPIIPPTVQGLWTLRNPSAFIVDGLPNSEQKARISLGNQAGIVFRSGVNNDGVVENFEGHEFAVDPRKKTPSFGNYVFIVEGALDISGQDNTTNALEILSLEVNPFGGPIQIDEDVFLFPARTFARDVETNYIMYNRASFLINERVNLFDVALKHTDENRQVNHGRDQNLSAPTYMGANRLENCGMDAQLGSIRPTLNFYDSVFLVHTSVAMTGFDIWVPNDPQGNLSPFVFYQNGRVLDDGTGRAFVLGVVLESSIDEQLKKSDIHITQDTPQAEFSFQEVQLLAAPNNTFINEFITGDISEDTSIHEIHLSNTSKIFIGTNGTVGSTRDASETFDLVNFPVLKIIGSFFSFTSDSTMIDLNAIHVDSNGQFCTLGRERGFIGVNVVKGYNGFIKLPRTSIEFDEGVGFTFRDLDLNDPNQRVIIDYEPATDILTDISNYTLDWMRVKKAYDVGYRPYELPSEPPICNLPPVLFENVIDQTQFPLIESALPIIRGDVDQFQIKRSRVGDKASIYITNRGFVRELVFLRGCNQLEAPVANIVLDIDAIVGLGNAQRDVDSVEGSITLGMNGITIIANGDGIVHLNSDLQINDQGSILRGPTFGLQPNERATLTITSQVPRELRVKRDAVLDLSQFLAQGVEVPGTGLITLKPDRILIAGDVRVVLEPGAKVILGGGILEFTDNAKLIAEPYVTAFEVFNPGSDVTATDERRAKILGTGQIVFSDQASFEIPRDAYVGIETDIECFPETNIMLKFVDSGSMHIGTDDGFGGSFQVGNTENRLDDVVSFTLEIDGPGALVEIGKQGFFGIATGIVYKQSTDEFGNLTTADSWRIGALYNVNSVIANVKQGVFKHSVIESTDGINASVLALGPLQDLIRGRAVVPGRYQVTPRFKTTTAGGQQFAETDVSQFKSLSGGNFVAVMSQQVTNVAPTVRKRAGEVAPHVLANVAPSTPLYANASKTADNNEIIFNGANIETMAKFMSTPNIQAPGQRLANIAPEVGDDGRKRKRKRSLLSFVDGEDIVRDPIDLVNDSANHDPSLAIGGVALGVSNNALEL